MRLEHDDDDGEDESHDGSILPLRTFILLIAGAGVAVLTVALPLWGVGVAAFLVSLGTLHKLVGR
jgi:hypothetical protein